MSFHTKVYPRREFLAWGTIVLLLVTRLTTSVVANLGQSFMARGLITDLRSLPTARNIFLVSLWLQQTSGAYLGLCRIDLAQENLDLAYFSCRQANASVDQMVTIADMFDRQHNQPKALIAYELARDLYPGAALTYYRLGQHYPAGQSITVNAYQQAISLTKGGDATLTKWELVDAHVQLAQNYLWWNAYQQVIQESQTALTLSPDGRAYRLQALAYAHLNQMALAQSSMESAIQLDNSFWVYLDWGDVYQIAGQLDAAAEKYGEAARLANGANQPQAYERLCRLYVDHSDGHRALPACQTLVERFGRNVPALLMLGDAYRLSGDIDSARIQYQTILKADPQNQQALERLNQP